MLDSNGLSIFHFSRTFRRTTPKHFRDNRRMPFANSDCIDDREGNGYAA